MFQFLFKARRNKSKIMLCHSVCGLLAWIHLCAGSGVSQEKLPEPESLTKLQTVAEASQYKATARGSQVESFLRRVDSAWESATLEVLGRSIEERPIWGLVIQPTQKTLAKPLTVLVLGGIHAGECDGKEAILALARDMALGQVPKEWSQLRLILVPNFNVDGAERIGSLHRPGQAGPADGMGIRENAQQLDLNRDFIKLESPEVRALVSAINKYDVDVLVDMHTTNGSLHRYDLTYAVPNNAIANSEIVRWSRSHLLPTISERLDKRGFGTFFYGNFDSEHQKWTTFGHEPRYSTEYMGLRGKLGILVESYAYSSYQRRVESNVAFLSELLSDIAISEVQMRDMFDRQVAKLTSHSGNELLPIRCQVTMSDSSVAVKGYSHADQSPPKPPYGPHSTTDLRTHDYQVELWNHASPVKEVPLPYAYAIPQQYAWAISRLAMHGVRLEALVNPETIAGEVLKIEKMETVPKAVHGHRMHTVTVKSLQEKVPLEAGTTIVRTAQPLGRLAAYLLEPEADDSLARWNFFDPDLRQGSTYPVVRLVSSNLNIETRAIAQIEPTERLSLEKLLKPGRITDYGSERIPEVRWLDRGSTYLTRENEEWKAVDAQSGAQRPFHDIDRLKSALEGLDAFNENDAEQAATIDAFSRDLRFALINHQQDLYFYDARTGSARRVTHSPAQIEELGELSPTGRHVAFVHKNNLWIADCESIETKQITGDGSSELLNGILDWVYQEELYGRGNFKAFWWSPDGSRLAMLQLDQTNVEHFKVNDSVNVRQILEDTRYPKAGQSLPIARLFIVDVPSGGMREVRLPGFPDNDRLIVRATWSPTNQLWVQVQNRLQNRQVLMRVDPVTGSARSVLSEKSNRWLEILGVPSFLPNGDFLWLSDLPIGRRHLQLISSRDGSVTQLTQGAWDIGELLSVSKDGKRAFVTSNIAGPIEHQLVAVDIDNRKFHQVTRSRGNHRVLLDPDGRFFIDSHSRIDQPTITSVKTINDEMLRILGAPISDRYRYVDVATPNLLNIETRDGVQLAAMVMLPSDVANGRVKKKLPVLFHVYGGPQAPTVRDIWQGRNYWWHQLLCQRGFAVVMCDNRAALGRGINDTWAIHRDLGKVELQDLEDAVRWVKQQTWADDERLGIWGWSYGGYFSAYALTHSRLFKVGIAGAPVTDWLNYDAIYTERYMGLPRDNQSGYRSSSVVAAAENLHGRLLLIHGERDDNVHLSNTLQFAYALQNAGKAFDMMIYPKNRHGIVDADQRYHMHQMMTEFLHEHLQGR